MLVLAGPYRKARRIRLGNRTYDAYVADNVVARAIGYMFRDPSDIRDGECMLFIFQGGGRHCFWMLDVHFDTCLYSRSGRSGWRKVCIMRRGSIRSICAQGHTFAEVMRRK
ncbi:MAG: DUF192 domain-containing protein [Candidatus Micrarchaeota archaeon]|nr:DUF192 domain-containing protein [Candidatus Micrarchaeota archaeon]